MAEEQVESVPDLADPTRLRRVLWLITNPLCGRIYDLIGIGPLKVLQDECSYEERNIFLGGGLGGDEAEDLIDYGQLEGHVDGTIPKNCEDASADLRL